jgi:hypothetical protein
MRSRIIAAVELVLIFPGALFMAALVLRNLQPFQNSAQQLVMWYANRMWTLGVLLLALPFVVLITGCAALLHIRDGGALVPHTRGWFAVIRGNSPAMHFVAATTLAAAAILAIVVLHMAAN